MIRVLTASICVNWIKEVIITGINERQIKPEVIAPSNAAYLLAATFLMAKLSEILPKKNKNRIL